MAGIEVVGVVLGSFPLLISGIEHYSKGIDTLSDIHWYDEIRDNLKCHFDTISALYHDSCSKLLEPLLLSESEKANLLDENEQARRVAWENKDLAEGLQNQLGAFYAPYIGDVTSLEKELERFRRKVLLEGETKVYFISDSSPLHLLILGRHPKKKARL